MRFYKTLTTINTFRGLGFWICFIISTVLSTSEADTVQYKDTASNIIFASVYEGQYKKSSSFYTKMWGIHYRPLYYVPIEVQSIALNSMMGGLHSPRQTPYFYGLLLENNNSQTYLLKLLGGITSFSESSFFRDVYSRKMFANTYIGNFVERAYTIQHPYAFMVSDELAKSTNLYSGNSRIYHIAQSEKDTIANGATISNKLVSIEELPDPKSNKIITDVTLLLDNLHKDSKSKVNQEKYIKTRLLDMLVGDWNKIPENFYWIVNNKTDSTIYEPAVIDRSYAFTKVDGIAFRQLLDMLNLDFMLDYKNEIQNLRKLNKLGYALDIALTSDCNEPMWIEQASRLKEELNDSIIDEAFRKLPSQMQNETSVSIKEKLKNRKSNLEKTASQYYQLLQKTPIIVGSHDNERFDIKRIDPRQTQIQIYKKDSDSLIFDKVYDRKTTKEIWIYSLDGHDIFNVNGDYDGGIPVSLIGGMGINHYNITKKSRIVIYEGETQKEYQKSNSILPKARIIVPSDEEALNYNYKKIKYNKFSINPIGLYDSDQGLDIGTSLSYTTYGFRRAPYSTQHQLSYNFNSGFIYQGIFPDFNSKKSFHLFAFLGSPNYFTNFFGFGNDTEGYKDKPQKYNRVNLKKYVITPGFYYTINKDQEINLSSSFEAYKLERTKGESRYLDELYQGDDEIYQTKYFSNININYSLDKEMNSFVSSIRFTFNPGWIINLGDSKRSFAYIKSDIGVNLKLTQRLTFATLVKGTALFSDKYEFYQAATTELRGFRNNRFIGKRSLYQYSDLRLDMGRIENPFTPLSYGIFAGVDHGRVWFPDNSSKGWHTSYGGGFWLTLFEKFTGEFSYFGSMDSGRFTFGLGFSF